MPLDEKRRLKIAVAIVGFLALLLVYMVWDQGKKISLLRETKEATDLEIDQLKLIIKDKPALEARRDFLARTLAEDVKILPDEAELARFFYTISEIRKEAGVNPVDIGLGGSGILKFKAERGLIPHAWDLTLC